MSKPDSVITVHLDPKLLVEMKCEAHRLDRSLSWVAQAAWRVARKRLQAVPAPHGSLR